MNKNRVKEAKKVTIVGFFINIILTVLKLFAGIIGHSSAMVADAIHSLSDFVTDAIVLVFINISGKDEDKSHSYGHGKFETFATMIISFFLFCVGIYILISGLLDIVNAMRGESLKEPQIIAFYAAVFSIITKEILYRYTVKVGRKINNYAVIANAWHHRTDALSSIGAAIGILGAIILSGFWSILDPVAGVVVSFFIMKVAVQLGFPSVKELLESALPTNVEEEIKNTICSVNEVKNTHNLRTRKIGSTIAIDVHVMLDKNISFVNSHEIATEIEKKLREKYGSETHISIHTEPI